VPRIPDDSTGFFSHQTGRTGISLIEVLLCIVLLASFTLPMALLLQRSGVNSRGVELNTARQVVFNRILNDIDPENPDFYNTYNKAAMQTITVNGLTIPYITKVDDANSNALKRRVHIYLYRNSTDALSAPYYSYTVNYNLDELRIDCGETTLGRIDDSGQVWSPDIQYDPTTNKTHAGWNTAGAGAATTAGTVVNVSTTNNPNYTTYRRAGTTIGNNFEYRFDVDNANYVVRLYFAELSASTTRTLDVSVEGSVPTNPNMSNFNAYTAAGSTNLKAVVRSIPVTVTDGTLNVIVTTKTTGQEPRLMAIVLRRAP
jgi:hypothetical protein